VIPTNIHSCIIFCILIQKLALNNFRSTGDTAIPESSIFSTHDDSISTRITDSDAEPTDSEQDMTTVSSVIAEITTVSDLTTDMEITSEKEMSVVSIDTTDENVDHVTEVNAEPDTTEAPIEETAKPVDESMGKVPSEGHEEIITESPEIEVTTLSSGTCMKSGVSYQNGESVPTEECQDSCTCDNGEIHCQTQSCPPAPPAFLKCARVDESGSCCPSFNCRKYLYKTCMIQCPVCFLNCEDKHLINYNIFSIANDTSSQTTCMHNGEEIADGADIPSPDICTACFCVAGESICATLECEAPGPRCSPISSPVAKCCPDVYDCSEYNFLECGFSNFVGSFNNDDNNFFQFATVGEVEEEATTLSTSIFDDEIVTQAPVLEGVCEENGTIYEHGSDVPVPPMFECAEKCICSHGSVVCVTASCHREKPPAFLRCEEVMEPGQCCPTYNCG